jgi:hypothetical protein
MTYQRPISVVKAVKASSGPTPTSTVAPAV